MPLPIDEQVIVLNLRLQDARKALTDYYEAPSGQLAVAALKRLCGVLGVERPKAAGVREHMTVSVNLLTLESEHD